MGYACPVCSDPQADAGHLANHLAFTAMLGDDDHEAWLDERVPGWGELGEDELADELAAEVEETEFPQLFEDTAGGLESGSTEPPAERSGALFEEGEHAHEGDHRHRAEHAHGADRGSIEDIEGGPTDEETAEILAEAREMTEQMLGDAGGSESENAGDEERTDDE